MNTKIEIRENEIGEKEKKRRGKVIRGHNR